MNLNRLTRSIGMVLLLFVSSLAMGQLNVSFQGNLDYSADLSDIWGWADGNGNEYALLGLRNGVAIIDVTDPTNPIERDFISGANSTWRDLKTWGNYAYVTNESSGGLLIIDLSNLPGSVSSSTWTGGVGFSTAHNIFIDENGVAYLCGSNTMGTIFIDVDANPTNPPILGNYNTRYVHDLYVRGDTMWTSEINNGIFSVVDVSNKALPVVMATQSTTSTFTHNCWLTDDGTTLITTDEVSGAEVGVYDVSDLSDIQRVDGYLSNPGSNSIPHNTFVKDNFMITAWYRDGLRICDLTIPSNVIEVGFYDTSPFSGSGFNGAWGVYPYLPSGNVLISDIEEGLFVLTPTYTGAAYLSGIITDASTGFPLFDATVSFSGGADATSDITGSYATGNAGGGTFTVTVSRAGYATQTITGVSLSAGSTTTLNVALNPVTAFTLTGQVVDAVSGAGIAGADVLIESPSISFTATTNSSGNFTVPGVFTDNYDVYAGKWGHVTDALLSQSLSPGSSTVTIALDEGFYDDYIFDFGWSEVSTSSTGQWERGEPIGTTFTTTNDTNPDDDASGDFGDQAYVTGNGGGGAGTDDIDNGVTTLTCPSMDLSGYGDPYLNFERWWFNDGGSTAPNDSYVISVSNGSSTAVIATYVDGDPFESQWRAESYRLLDFISLSANMTISFESSDLTGTGHLVEAGVDVFNIVDAAPPTPCSTAPANNMATGITETGVTVTWDAVPGAVNYNLEGTKVNLSVFKTANSPSNSRTFNVLKPNTSYKWRVRANCGGGVFSPWTALDTFTTLIPRIAMEEGLTIYPNPAANQINIAMDMTQATDVYVQMFDMKGAQVAELQSAMAEGLNVVPMDVSKLVSGTYLLQIRYNGIIQSKTIAIK